MVIANEKRVKTMTQLEYRFSKWAETDFISEALQLRGFIEIE